MVHTCDDLKRSFREIFLSFQGGFGKMYIIDRKLPDQFQRDFEF